jgi:hypothetical protein
MVVLVFRGLCSIFLRIRIPKSTVVVGYFRVESVYGFSLAGGPVILGNIMRIHSIQVCIDLAEAIPQDRGNYGVVRELLVELHHLAKAEEAAA